MSAADEKPDAAAGSSQSEEPGAGETLDGPADRPPVPRTPPSPSHVGALRAAERERDAAEASRDRFAFLAEVSRCLADSLDYETTLTTVAGLSLPYLGAWCIVDVLTEDGTGIRRLAVLHPDAEKQALARELHQRYPPHPDDLIGAPRVMRTRRPEVVVDIPDEALVASARDTEHLALLRALGTKAYVIAPMIARGHVLGAMTFVTADATHRFGDIDVVIAEDIARRAALAVDNARLHRAAEEAREAAETAHQEAELALEEAEEASEAARTARGLAEEALRLRDEFVAMMSHEIRTPLNAILGYAQLIGLELEGALTDAQRSYLERLHDSGQHVLRLFEDVLDLSKAEAGKLAVSRDVVPAAETARSAVAEVEPQASGNRVTLVDACASSGELRYIGDEDRVRQVLVNLLTNAIKFTDPGGRVTLECGWDRDERVGEGEERPASGRWVLFRVRDTGPGVPADTAETIFEPFVQGESGLQRTRGGSGLGLTISRRLARLMGGDVTVEPLGEGRASESPGATFTLRLHAAAESE